MKSNCLGTYSRRRLRAMTLVEVLIVVTVLAIVASVAVTQTGNADDEAAAATTATDLRTIVSTATQLRSLNGKWPGPTNTSNAPGDFAGRLSADAFTKQPAIGTGTPSNYYWFSTPTGSYAVAYAAYVDPDRAMLVDDLIDDGDATTGRVTVNVIATSPKPLAAIYYWVRRP